MTPAEDITFGPATLQQFATPWPRTSHRARIPRMKRDAAQRTNDRSPRLTRACPSWSAVTRPPGPPLSLSTGPRSATR
jgi:hypothetical protein